MTIASQTTTTTSPRMTVSTNLPGEKKYVGSGVILTRLDGDAPRFMLLLGQETGVWSFPKGHPEQWDRGSPLRTAVRETYEETGYLAGQHYQIMGESLRFGKRPYWVGLMNEGEVPPPRICGAEHSLAGWFTLAEIEGLNSNTDVRAWVKKANLTTSGFVRVLQALPRLASSSTRSKSSSVPAYNGS